MAETKSDAQREESRPESGIRKTQWDGLNRGGPGAATASVPVVEAEPTGHTLEPRWKRVPVGPDHILYPVLVGLALFPILMGSAGHHLADDMPDDETHPFFPDHFWPYPIIMVLMLVTVGLLAAFVQKNMELEQSADPRAVVLPRPDWYFLFLFQFLKLGPELIMSLVIPPLVVLGLLLWPFIDGSLGTRLARRLGWETWPVPGRNVITGTGWVLFLGFIVLLTFWALSGVTILGVTGG
jgi:quinol-cytochrome oxidoreductase complex cytochrome b subunit